MKWLRLGVIPAIALLVNGGLAAQDAGLAAGAMQLHQVWATPSAYTADTGASLPAFSQSPTLDAAVASGDLPPVEERLPIEPLVVLGVDGPGLYGGTFFNATYDVGLATALRDETAIILNKHSFTADPYPNVTKSYTAVDDASSVWELRLREGLRWSDGTPFTTADFTFWWDDVILNEDITPQLRPQYRGVTITAIDDYTVQFDFGVPADFVARGGGFNPITRFPRHYLEQFHAEYASESDLADMVKKSGFESWTQFFLDRADYNEYGNVDKPTLEPWELSEAPPSDPVIWTRNPYFWVVDTEGKQLPYFEDRRTSVLGDQEVVKLKALNGEVDYSFLDIDVYTLAKRAEQDGIVRVYVQDNPALVASQLDFNLNHPDPVMREVFWNPQFKRAISHAIDRELINQILYEGLSYPSQVSPLPSSPYFSEALQNEATAYDVELANSILDELGHARNDAGVRTFPNGEPMALTFLSFDTGGLPTHAEIITDGLKEIGVELTVRFVDWGVLTQARNAGDYDGVLIWESWGTNEGLLVNDQAAHFVPNQPLNFWTPKYRDYTMSGGEQGEEPNAIVQEALDYYLRAQATLDLEERKELFGHVLEIARENLWSIGTVRHPGFVIMVTPEMRGIPGGRQPMFRGDHGRRDAFWKAQ